MFIEIEEDSWESDNSNSSYYQKLNFDSVKQIAEGCETRIFVTPDNLVVKASKHLERGPCPNQSLQIHSKSCSLLENEYETVKNLQYNNNIIQYHYIERNCCIQGKDYCAIVMDRMQGDFFEFYIKPENFQNNYNLYQFKLSFAKIVQAVGMLHAQGITHNDIKPENILLKSEDDNDFQNSQNNNKYNNCKRFQRTPKNDVHICVKDFEPILSDFGCATNYYQIGQLSPQNQRETWNKRDLSYMGAEVYEFLNSQDSCGFDEFKNDIFSLGQTMFTCMTKQYPRKFKIPTSKCTIYQQIINQDVKGFWNQVQNMCLYLQNFDICQDFLDLCMKMMAADPQQRPTPIEILRHRFFEDVIGLI